MPSWGLATLTAADIYVSPSCAEALLVSDRGPSPVTGPLSFSSSVQGTKVATGYQL